MNWLDIATLIIGNGAVLAIFSLFFSFYQLKAGQDFEARKTAQGYYRELYGNIAVLDELMRGYHRSIIAKEKMARVFTKECEYIELTEKEMLKRYNEAYLAFSTHYIKKKCEGYEIFVSEKLANTLIDYWTCVKNFYENDNEMTNKKEVDDTHKLAEKATKQMEKLYGLK